MKGKSQDDAQQTAGENPKMTRSKQLGKIPR
jgi:hypothetical protein